MNCIPIVHVTLAAAAAALAVPAAGAYPEKPIRLVVPLVAGGPTDMLARLIAVPLSARLGQQVVVDNRPGAGGNIGAETAAKAAPDGYTLLMAAATTHAVSMSLYARLGYDLERDLAPVSLVANAPHVLV